MNVGTDLPLPQNGIYLCWKDWAHPVWEGPLSLKAGYLACFAKDFI